MCGDFLQAKLIMASSHIGNPDDVPPRTLNALKMTDLLVFEEKKPAKQLLKRCGITRDFLIFNEHSQEHTLRLIQSALSKGQTVMYCSDQGSPSIADPGCSVASIAYQLKVAVQVIPGPSSITAAITASPIPTPQFHFLGFPPRKAALRKSWFTQADKLQGALVILDTPYRRQPLLEDGKQWLLSHKRAFLGVDISLEDEQYFLGSFTQVIKQTQNLDKKNFVLICYDTANG